MPTETDTVIEPDEIAEVIDRFVDEHRVRALWFLREDFYPRNTEERLRVLRYIEERSDVPTFKRVARLRKCLLQNSSEKSAGS